MSEIGLVDRYWRTVYDVERDSCVGTPVPVIANTVSVRIRTDVSEGGVVNDATAAVDKKLPVVACGPARGGDRNRVVIGIAVVYQ